MEMLEFEGEPRKSSNITPLIHSEFDYTKRTKLRLELEKLFFKLEIDEEMGTHYSILAEMIDNFLMVFYNTKNNKN